MSTFSKAANCTCFTPERKDPESACDGCVENYEAAHSTMEEPAAYPVHRFGERFRCLMEADSLANERAERAALSAQADADDDRPVRDTTFERVFRTACEDTKRDMPPVFHAVNKAVDAVYSRVPGLFRSSMLVTRLMLTAVNAVRETAELLGATASPRATRYNELVEYVIRGTKDACRRASIVWAQTGNIKAARQVLETHAEAAAALILHDLDVIK